MKTLAIVAALFFAACDAPLPRLPVDPIKAATEQSANVTLHAGTTLITASGFQWGGREWTDTFTITLEHGPQTIGINCPGFVSCSVTTIRK